MDRDFTNELQFKSSKSSGKGGQHVNKTESRISLFFQVDNSELLNSKEKKQLHIALKGRLNNEGYLQIDVEKTRSQYKNKKIAIEQFHTLIENGLKKKEVRIPSKPSKAAIKKRLEQKKIQALKKQRRTKNF